MKVFAGRLSAEVDTSTIDSSLEIIRNEDTIIVFCPNDEVDSTERTLLDLGFRSVDVPKVDGDPSSVASKLESELAQLRNERDSIDHEIEALAKRHGDWLVSCEEHYSALSEKSSLPLKLATTENMFVMDGWVPSKSVSELQQALQKLDVYYELDNESSDSPPIKFDNPEAMKPFEMFNHFSHIHFHEIIQLRSFVERFFGFFLNFGFNHFGFHRFWGFLMRNKSTNTQTR